MCILVVRSTEVRTELLILEEMYDEATFIVFHNFIKRLYNNSVLFLFSLF